MRELDNGLVYVGGVAFPSAEAARDVGYEPNHELRSIVQNSVNASRQVSLSLLNKARAIKDTYREARGIPKEHIPLPELRNMARDLKKLGADVPPYSRMRSFGLYRAIEDIVDGILA